MTRDVTDAKRLQEELRTARDQAIDSSRTKSAFLANVSHEIRTPLNGVIGMTELLLDTPLVPAQREYAETVRSSADLLLAILNDVLDLSRIEAGKLELERRDFDPQESLEEVLQTLSSREATAANRPQLVLTFGQP